jgi:hypothetical protein
MVVAFTCNRYIFYMKNSLYQLRSAVLTVFTAVFVVLPEKYY